MASPVRRDDSAFLQLRKRIAADVLAKAKGRAFVIELPAVGSKPAVTVSAKLAAEVKLSLRTADPAEAKVRMASATAALGAVVDGIRKGPVALTHMQVVALSGDVYRAFVAQWEAEPDSPDRWAAFKAFSRAIREGRLGAAPTVTLDDAKAIDEAVMAFGRDLTAGVDALPREASGAVVDAAMEFRFGWLTDWTLIRRGLVVDRETRAKLIREVDKASTDAAWRLKRAADGDYRPDATEARFPAFEQAKQGVTLPDLFERWRAETKPAGSTITTTRGIVTKLDKHVGGGRAADITAEQVVAWKDALIASGNVSARTLNDTYFRMLKAIFNFGVTNKLVRENPVKDLKVAVRSQAGTSKLPYEDAEVARLLVLARSAKRPAFLWLPWLAAATGARIGELAQAWGSNIVTVDGVTVLHIRPAPDAGSLKTESSERTVPLHPAIIAEGFMEYVREKGDGPLFYKRSSGRKGHGTPARAWRTISRNGCGNRASPIPGRRRTTPFGTGGSRRRSGPAWRTASPITSRDTPRRPSPAATAISTCRRWRRRW